MFDKQKIIAMTTALEEFVRAHPNIFILPEVWSGNVLSLLKRLKANVAGILTNAPVVPEQNMIQTPSGNYPLVNFPEILSKLNPQTGIIVPSAKPTPNPIILPTFNIGDIKISIPAFALTDEEAMAIYDRITTIETLKRYQEDGVIANGAKDISIRFARGMSTFIDSRYQDVKVQVWDRREFKIQSYDVDDAAIVMQGPLEYKDNYTITTAQLYREWYPKAHIIISTWKNETTDTFREKCKKMGVVLLENELPIFSGSSNINYQLESSFKGVEYVKNNTSAKYVLKCRTDQRINRTDFLHYFKNLLKIFPTKDDKINKRILLLGWSKWWPFFTNDFLYFGDIEDMNKLLAIPKQTKSEADFVYSGMRWHNLHRVIIHNRFMPKLKLKCGRKLHKYNIIMNNCRHSEIFILRSFHEKYIGLISPEKLLQTYWKFLRDYLIIVDEINILLDWPKYHTHGAFNGAYNAKSYYDRGLDNARWLDIYLNYKDEDE